MKPITEQIIEDFAIGLLEKLGYEYIYAPNIAPDSITPERDSFEQVILRGRLEKAVRRINYTIPIDAQNEAIKEIQRIASPELLANNEAFHRFLTEGVPVSKRIDGDDRGDRVWLIDFKDPMNNEFVVANQMTIVENGQNKRPDIILLDLNLPKLDGREVLEIIKKDDALKLIPVIVLTTSDAERDILNMYANHANCYITKPVDFDQFINVVKSIESFWLSIVKLPPKK